MPLQSKLLLSSLGLLLFLPSIANSQVPLFPPHNPCEGTWIASLPFGPPGSPALIAQFTFTPLDPSGQHMLVWGAPVNPLRNPGDPRLFPTTTAVSASTGVAERRSANTYRLRWIGYATKAPAATGPTSWFRAEVQQIYIQDTTIECRGDTIRETGSFFVYSTIDDPTIVVPELSINGVRDQDKDKDGLPDEGEQPILSIPFDWTLKRFV